MKRMKEEHIDLVERMQGAYREIEKESKVRGSLKYHLLFLYNNYEIIISNNDTVRFSTRSMFSS